MKKIISIFILAFCLTVKMYAQDDLLGSLEKEQATQKSNNITTATFKATKIINMQSVEMTGAGNLQFIISHHFGNLWNKDNGAGTNFAQLFGLNSGVAHTYLSFDYSINRWCNLGLAATGNSHFEGTAKFKILRQQSGTKNYPVTLVWLSQAHVDANKNAIASGETPWNRYSYMHQLLIARKFNDKLSLQLMPTLVHYNIVPYGINNSNNVWSVGIGGRYKFSNRKAITLEYSRQLNNWDYYIDKGGNVLSYQPNLLSLGYDWDTGGHIFQFFISTTTSAFNIEQLSRNSNDLSKMQFALGFNINRSFGVKKVVKK